jgi:hypothetical protein
MRCVCHPEAAEAGSAKRDTAEDAEGSQASLCVVNPAVFLEELRILSSFTVLRRFRASRSTAPAVQDDKNEIHSPCGNIPRNPADKNGFARPASDRCGKRTKSPSLFRDETRSSGMEGTAILSKPLQCDAEFFRTHPLLPLLTKRLLF